MIMSQNLFFPQSYFVLDTPISSTDEHIEKRKNFGSCWIPGSYSFKFSITAMGRLYSDLVLPTMKHKRVLGSSTFSYKRPCPDEHNEYWVVDAEPNGIMPPLPRRAMGPDRNCRQLDCPVPIAHRGRGSAEVDLKATFSYNCHGQTSF